MTDDNPTDDEQLKELDPEDPRPKQTFDSPEPLKSDVQTPEPKTPELPPEPASEYKPRKQNISAADVNEDASYDSDMHDRARESRMKDGDEDVSAAEAALDQELSNSTDERVSDDDKAEAAERADEYNRNRAKKDADQALKERRKAKAWDGIEAVATTLPGIAMQTTGDVLGSVRTLVNSFLSGGPMTMSSRILGEVMSDTSAMENRLNTLHEQYGILRDSDPRLTADTVKGRMMRAATREEMEGIAYANSSIDLMLRTLGEDPSQMNEASLQSVQNGIDRETARLNEELRTGKDKDGNKLNARQRRVRQAQLRQYNEALTGINKKVNEAKKYAREDYADARQADSQHRRWEREVAGVQRGFEREHKAWEKEGAQAQRDFEREHKAWERDKAAADKKYNKDLSDWQKREDARWEQKRSDDRFNAGTPAQQRVWTALGRDIDLDEEGIPTDSRHLNRLTQVAADRLRSIEGSLLPGEKPEDNEDYQRWQAVLNRVSQVREQNKARMPLTDEQREAQRIKEEKEARAAAEAKAQEDRYNAGSDPQKRVWDISGDRTIDLYDDGTPVDSRHLESLRKAVSDKIFAREKELRDVDADPSSDEEYRKLQAIHGRIQDRQKWNAEQNLSPEERENRRAKAEAEARAEEVYRNSNAAQRIVRDMLGKKDIPLDENGVTLDHSSINSVITKTRAWLSNPANADSEDRPVVEKILDAYRHTALTNKNLEKEFYDQVSTLSDGLVNNSRNSLNAIVNECRNGLADWYKEHGIDPSTYPTPAEVGEDAYAEFYSLFTRRAAAVNGLAYHEAMNRIHQGAESMGLNSDAVERIGMTLKTLQIKDHEDRMNRGMKPDTISDFSNAVRGFNIIFSKKSQNIRDELQAKMDQIDEQLRDMHYRESKGTISYEEFSELKIRLNRQKNGLQRIINGCERMPDVLKPAQVAAYKKNMNIIGLKLNRLGLGNGSGGYKRVKESAEPTSKKKPELDFGDRGNPLPPPAVPEGSVHSEGDGGSLSDMQRLAKEMNTYSANGELSPDFVYETMLKLANSVRAGEPIDDDALTKIYTNLYDSVDDKSKLELQSIIGVPEQINGFFDKIRPEKQDEDQRHEVEDEGQDESDEAYQDLDSGNPNSSYSKDLRSFKNKIAQMDRGGAENQKKQVMSQLKRSIADKNSSMEDIEKYYQKLRMLEDWESEPKHKGEIFTNEERAELAKMSEIGIYKYVYQQQGALADEALAEELKKNETFRLQLATSNKALEDAKKALEDTKKAQEEMKREIANLKSELNSGTHAIPLTPPASSASPAPPLLVDSDMDALKNERKKKREEYLNSEGLNKDAKAYVQQLEKYHRGSADFNENLRTMLNTKLASGPLDTDLHPEMRKFVSDMVNDLVGVFSEKDPQKTRESIDKLLVEAGPKEAHGSLYGGIPRTVSSDSRKEIDGTLFDLSNFLQNMNICSAKTAREKKEKRKETKKEPKLMHSNIDTVLPEGPIREAFKKIDDARSIKGFESRKNFFENLSEELTNEGINEDRNGNQMTYSYTSLDNVQGRFLRALYNTLNNDKKYGPYENDKGEDDEDLIELANLLYDEFNKKM